MVRCVTASLPPSGEKTFLSLGESPEGRGSFSSLSQPLPLHKQWLKSAQGQNNVSGKLKNMGMHDSFTGLQDLSAPGIHTAL